MISPVGTEHRTRQRSPGPGVAKSEQRPVDETMASGGKFRWGTDYRSRRKGRNILITRCTSPPVGPFGLPCVLPLAFNNVAARESRRKRSNQSQKRSRRFVTKQSGKKSVPAWRGGGEQLFRPCGAVTIGRCSPSAGPGLQDKKSRAISRWAARSSGFQPTFPTAIESCCTSIIVSYSAEGRVHLSSCSNRAKNGVR